MLRRLRCVQIFLKQSDEREFVLISRFLPFSYEKFAYELHSSNENCDTSASFAAFFEVRNVR